MLLQEVLRLNIAEYLFEMILNDVIGNIRQLLRLIKPE